jgi:hypothetical protein
MRTRMRVIQGQLAEVGPHRTSAIEAAYQHFRLDKQESLVSPKTLRHYEWTIRPFLRWLEEEHPQVARLEQLGVDLHV